MRVYSAGKVPVIKRATMLILLQLFGCVIIGALLNLRYINLAGALVE